MTDMRVRKGNRVDEIVLNLEAAGYLQSIFEKLREKNRTNYEIYVSVTLYDIPNAFSLPDIIISQKIM